MTPCASFEILSEYVGDEVADKLVSAFGGRDIRVPKLHAGPTWERLVEALGREDAGRVADAFGGDRIYVPLDATGRRKRLHDMIIRELRRGRSPQEVASEMRIITRVSERYVRRVAISSGLTSASDRRPAAKKPRA